MVDITNSCFIINSSKALSTKLIWKKDINEEIISVHVCRWDVLIPRSLHDKIKAHNGKLFCDGNELYANFKIVSDMVKFKLVL